MTQAPLIYVVEDDEASRELLVRRLRKRGYRAEPIASGESCLERLPRELPELVLLDLVMPAMGGLDVLRTIRRTHSLYQLPVIVVTGKVTTEEVVDGLDVGANDYVTKSITFPVLEARIKTQIAMKQSIEALLQAERQRVMIESLGAACHHISQPMTSVMGNLGLLQESLGPDDADTRDKISDILKWTEQVRSLLDQFRTLREYRPTPYVGDSHILDIRAD
ncbi:MAG: response regulator [Acidobacteria bacterium]|nr:response regulator [Acidobacteriota bacterium]